MATVTNKRKVLGVEGKFQVIRVTENGGWGGEADLCRKFCLVHSTAQKISKTRNEIISLFEWSGSTIKRFRKPETKLLVSLNGADQQ